MSNGTSVHVGVMSLLFFFYSVYKLMITDSIGKYVNKVKNTKLQALPGYTISRTTDAIAFGNITVSGYRAILIHMGTNDIPPSQEQATGITSH